MTKKVVNADYNVSGMSAFSIHRQFRRYLRMPYIAIAEGPGLDCIYQLFRLHTIGRLMVVLEIKYPTIYKWTIKIRDSLVFRYNHYKKSARNRLANKNRQ